MADQNKNEVQTEIECPKCHHKFLVPKVEDLENGQATGMAF